MSYCMCHYTGWKAVACVTHCTGCSSTPSSISQPLATGTETADSEATIWTVTVVTDIFIDPAYTFNREVAYAAMQSIHNNQKTLRPSGMTTSTIRGSSAITSFQQSSFLEASLISSGSDSIISSSHPVPASTSKQTSLVSLPPGFPSLRSTMVPTIPTTTSVPPPHDTASSYIDCAAIGCVGIARDDAIKSIKSFCRKPATINSATPPAVSSHPPPRTAGVSPPVS
ncbi:hypothetical protein BKA65DRAFT_500631 [Rhexocercosporidium sp. MPI-PUGE-AT-0058]|nr:hypothetical protein BKA65DRAFT_500631 [Rhexocercosporidium sp. MPI-PUGE-AT-0058]